jgi:hypothetical protein
MTVRFAGASGYLTPVGRRLGIHGGKSSQNYGFSVGELSDKGEVAPHGYDIATQGGNEQVGTFFQAGNAVLASLEDFSDARLGKAAGLPEIAQGHFLGDELCGAALDFLPARCAEFFHLVS